MKEKIALTAIVFLLLGIFTYLTITKKPNYEQLTKPVDVEKTLDHLNDSTKIKFLYEFDRETHILSIKDTIETPVLFNDLDSSLFINNYKKDFKTYILSSKVRIIISDEVLCLNDVYYNKKDFVVL